MSEILLWGLLFLFGSLVFAGVVVLLVKKVAVLPIFKKIDGSKRRYLMTVLSLAVVFILLTILMRGLNAAIVVIHILIFWLILDLINILAHKKFQEVLLFWTSVALTVVYLAVAFYLCFTVTKTNYQLTTSKDVGSIRVVQFADSHIGTTFDGDGLNRYVEEINSLNPDVVLITGDLVDDGTNREDMVAACRALGNLRTTYGVFFSFGNHDKGYSDSALRGFSGDDLIAELQKNNVIVLEDDSVLIDNRFYIVGRQDKSEADRADISELIENLDTDKYIIVMDHQPNDYDNEAATAADLVLSGHTHGGQLIPINDVGILIGANDATYGFEERNNTGFIVTSGISDWEVYFKSGTRSEYVVIDIT